MLTVCTFNFIVPVKYNLKKKKKNFKVDMHKLLHMNAMYKLNEEINSV